MRSSSQSNVRERRVERPVGYVGIMEQQAVVELPPEQFLLEGLGLAVADLTMPIGGGAHRPPDLARADFSEMKMRRKPGHALLAHEVAAVGIVLGRADQEAVKARMGAGFSRASSR